MNAAHSLRNRMLLPLALACAAFMAAPLASAGERTDADARHLIYLPSRDAATDHAANARAFEERGFSVQVMAQADESDKEYILRVRDEIRGMIDRGVDPSAITVLGSGRGSPVTALVSVATGNRHVNYVLLGRCDENLAANTNFRMSGRVLGLRDAGDRSSGSCRPLWRQSPKVTDRRDLVVHTGMGAALFDAPHEAWMAPVSAWSEGGRVDLGELKVASNR